MTNNMNEYKLWSDALTKNSLTTYAEGLVYDNFDANSWWVLNKQV